MADFLDIMDKIEDGRGKAADVLGQPFAAYRLVPEANGDLIQDTNLLTAEIEIFLQGAVAKDTKTGLETDARLGTFWYRVVTDLSDYKEGDIFIQTDTSNYKMAVSFETDEFRGFCLAEHGALRASFGARLNTLARIYRAACDVQTDTKFFASAKEASRPLRISSGQAALAEAVDEPSLIPIGLMSTGRTYGEKTIDGVPGAGRKSAWYCYVPPLPGFNFKESDLIVTPDGAQYRVLIAYKQDVGAVGSQLYLERESAGVGE